jgi:hypothetical protein
VLKAIEEGDKKGRPIDAVQRAVLHDIERLGTDGAVEMAMRAWGDLCTCRSSGFITGLIPWDKMKDWCDVEGLDADSRRILIGALRYHDIKEFEKRNPKKSPTKR